MREGILTARTPTVKLATLEVSTLGQTSTLRGYTGFPQRSRLNPGTSVPPLQPSHLHLDNSAPAFFSMEGPHVKFPLARRVR